MATESAARHTRRAILAAAAAAATATVAEAVVRPLTVSAAGNDGTAIVIGGLYADAQSQTTLANKANDEIVLWVASNAGAGKGGGTALVGHSDHGTGVLGQSPTGIGVRAESPSGTGLQGTTTSGTGIRAAASSGRGLHATSTTNRAVHGESTESYGVHGQSVSGIGVLAVSDQSVGLLADGATVGVQGVSRTDEGTGVRGNSVRGTGVSAESTAGVALSVEGKAHFSRSGRTTIPAGRSSLVVALPGTTPGSKVFAVLATNRSGRYVRAVVPAGDKFTVYLNVAVSSISTIAWFVLD